MRSLSLGLIFLILWPAMNATAQERSAAPLFGARALAAGFSPDPYEISVRVGDGEIDASTINSDCVGQISRAPTAIVRYTARANPGDPLYISVDSQVDTTLAVLAPDGQWYCNDDGGMSLNPLLQFDTPRTGRYRIWVGTFAADAGQTDARLLLSEFGDAAQGDGDRPDPTLDPAYGIQPINAATMVEPVQIEIAAGGTTNTSSVAPQCPGFVARAPDYRIQWTAAANAPLVLSVHSEADTVLLVNTADGSWICDDDSGGALDPRLTIEGAASGVYDVWVGLYAEGELQPSVLTVSNVAPQ